VANLNTKRKIGRGRQYPQTKKEKSTGLSCGGATMSFRWLRETKRENTIAEKIKTQAFFSDLQMVRLRISHRCREKEGVEGGKVADKAIAIDTGRQKH